MNKPLKTASSKGKEVKAKISGSQNWPQYNRLKIVLVEERVSQKELASRLGRAVATVSYWCTNRKQPSVETLFEIAKELQIHPARLLSSLEEAGI